MYSPDNRFKETIDKEVGSGTTDFVVDAFMHYLKEQ